MNLFQNPIFLTQKRLNHRGGVIAAILIAALIGFSLLAGLVMYASNPDSMSSDSVQGAARNFYSWLIGIEGFILILGTSSHIIRSLWEDRKAGLWDSNRLTPLTPGDLVRGYWFGAGMREIYMGLTLALIGLFIIVIGRLPISIWIGTQTLIFSTAAFFGLLAVLSGLVAERQNNGMALPLFLFVAQVTSFFGAPLFLTGLLLPFQVIVAIIYKSTAFAATVSLPLGISAPPWALTLILQAIIGLFLWRMAVSRTKNPFQPLLRRWEGVAMFAVLAGFQHALVWPEWSGSFGLDEFTRQFRSDRWVMAVVHGGTLALGLIILAFSSPSPERMRVGFIGTGLRGLGPVFLRSGAFMALMLSATAFALLQFHFLHSITEAWPAFLIAALNFFTMFLMFAFLLEYCRLRFRSRATSFIALGLFVLWVMPFIISAVSVTGVPAQMSFLSPGILALMNQPGEDFNALPGITVAHLAIVFALFIAWRNQWRRLLITHDDDRGLRTPVTNFSGLPDAQK